MINELNRKNLDYTGIISSIDLEDLTNFLVSLTTEEWVPTCYWHNKNIITEPTQRGTLYWGIYSYLVKNNHIRIENPHWVEREGHGNGNHRNEYYEHTSYYNPLEEVLYGPILMRLGTEKHLSSTDGIYWVKRRTGGIQHIKKHKLV
jgi:hypothetical protein